MRRSVNLAGTILKIGTKIKNKKGCLEWEVEKIEDGYIRIFTDTGRKEVTRRLDISHKGFHRRWELIN